ncbi:MAG: ABC transporter ATP-binding protein [Candidatus Riflebacteria bacterium]|nr:ABC transporter ATP-binding protein [Candidatus Riflebacteria bacterium]
MTEQDTASKDNAVVFSGVTFGYRPNETVLEDISFVAGTGTFTAVVGPNGGGKTTLIKLLLGLEKPLKGEITVLGTDPEKARKYLSYVPQFAKFDPAFPVSVMEVTLMGFLDRDFFFGRYSKAQREKALETLDLVGLRGKGETSFSELSGGQRQRVLIARALVSEPKLLLMDEPDASIDPLGTEELHDFIAGLKEKMTVFLVSHDLNFVSKAVDNILCVHKTLDVHHAHEIDSDVLSRFYGGGNMKFVCHDDSCGREE